MIANFLQIGDVVEIKEGMKIYAKIQSRFVYANRRTSKELTNTEILVGSILDDTKGSTLKTKKFAGTYVVFSAELTGGGGAPHDRYPDGWQVMLRKLHKDGTYDPDGIEISFYQSGCFTAMILPENIQPIKKMKHVSYFE